jgi:hypothetical protein
MEKKDADSITFKGDWMMNFGCFHTRAVKWNREIMKYTLPPLVD